MLLRRLRFESSVIFNRYQTYILIRYSESSFESSVIFNRYQTINLVNKTAHLFESSVIFNRYQTILIDIIKSRICLRVVLSSIGIKPRGSRLGVEVCLRVVFMWRLIQFFNISSWKFLTHL